MTGDWEDDEGYDSDLDICSNCGASVDSNAESCHVCGMFVLDEHWAEEERTANRRPWLVYTVALLIVAMLLPYLMYFF